LKVPIRNIYYLLCYAWRFIPDDLALDVGGIQNPDVLNLCAHVLTAGIDRLLRRGIDQGYLVLREETARLRGRIDITGTITGLTWLHARAVCQFDELTPDTLHNRILRSTVQLLASAPIERSLRDRLRVVDHQLSGINTISVQASLFKRVQLHRNNSFYAFLLRVCELVHLSLLPDKSARAHLGFEMCYLMKSTWQRSSKSSSAISTVSSNHSSPSAARSLSGALRRRNRVICAFSRR